jgi:hypothetical protein
MKLGIILNVFALILSAAAGIRGNFLPAIAPLTLAVVIPMHFIQYSRLFCWFKLMHFLVSVATRDEYNFCENATLQDDMVTFCDDFGADAVAVNPAAFLEWCTHLRIPPKYAGAVDFFCDVAAWVWKQLVARAAKGDANVPCTQLLQAICD